MKMPPSRRRSLTLLVGVLFAANVFGIFFALRSAVSGTSPSAQYAGSAQVTETVQTEEYATSSPKLLNKGI